MSRETFCNQGNTSLSSAITSTTATTISVVDATQLPSSPQFRLLINSELFLVTGISGNTLTVQRGAESTSPSTHGNGASVSFLLTKGSTSQLLRDNVPVGDDTGRPPFRLQDNSGAILTSSSFTIVNGTNATVTDQAAGSISIAKPKQVSSSYDLTFLARSAPATPYSVIAALDGFLPDSAAYSYFGLGFRSSSTGHISLLCLARYGGQSYLAVYHLNSPSSNAADLVSRFSVAFGTPKWFKVSDDGVNLTYYVSHDGIDWLQIGQEARTTFFTGGPDEVGAGFDQCGNTSYAGAVSLLSWSGA